MCSRSCTCWRSCRSKLSPEDTKQVVPIARALIGNRSAVVIKTPEGDVKERRIPAGSIEIIGAKKKVIVGVEEGAEKMMEAVNSVPVIEDIKGEPGTNAGGMLEKVRQNSGFTCCRYL